MTTRPYRQLTARDRAAIIRFAAAGLNYHEIARAMRRDVMTCRRVVLGINQAKATPSDAAGLKPGTTLASTEEDRDAARPS